MLKKPKKTKADQKEDAFERLYAILAAGTPGLQPLEKPLAPSVVLVKAPPTQEEKAKEHAEFNKLYAQLAALSAKRKEETVVPPVERVLPTPNVELAPTIPLVEPAPMVTDTSNREFDEIYAQIVRMIAMKTQIEPHVLLPPPKAKVKSKQDLQCEACCKIFCNSSSFIRHKRVSEACKAWYALPEDQQPPVVFTPIHEMVNQWLERAITGDKPLTCKFCYTTFYNRGNHHKHYQTAQTCNRMAYAEFKRITAL